MISSPPPQEQASVSSSSSGPIASKAAAQRGSLQNRRTLTIIVRGCVRARTECRRNTVPLTVMVVMTPGATQDQVDAVVARLAATGGPGVVLPGGVTSTNRGD